MRLATTFGRGSNFIQSRTPLSNEQLMTVAPSIFAPAKHESRSERYTYIPTVQVLDGLRKEGFEPFYAIQSKTRVPGAGDFTKHMVRMRFAGDIAGAEANEVILVNSHNGTSSYQLLAGIFRFVCQNGMVAGDEFAEVRVHHKGNIVDEVVQGAYTVTQQFKEIGEHVSEMKALPLSPDVQHAMGETALAIRYGQGDEPEAVAPVTVEQVLAPQRREDTNPDLFSVFNRIQENLVRGGLRSRSANGRRSHTRPVRGIDQNVSLNRALWNLAESIRKELVH